MYAARVRRIGLIVLLLLVAAVVLPPLGYALWPRPPGELPRGRSVALPSGPVVNVLDAGDGPPVVLVHGLPGSAGDWRPLHAALVDRDLRVIAYDRVGYGLSDPRPSGAATTARNAAELRELLTALDLRDATLAGWSYGGGVVLDAAHSAENAPAGDEDRIGRLVLLGSVGPGYRDGAEPGLAGRILFSRPVLAWVRRVPPVAAAARRQVLDQVFSGGPVPDWFAESARVNLGRPASFASWLDEEDTLRREPDPTPAGLHVPVLVIQGEDDRSVPVAVGRALAAAAPEGELLVVPEGSHMLPVTHPELLADRIAAFVRATSGAGAAAVPPRP